MGRARTISRILTPRPELAGCVMAAVLRDTRGCALSRQDRFNHFAASPLCGATWFFEGESRVIARPEQARDPEALEAAAPILFSGPQRRPMASWNPGPVHALLVVFYPDALLALSGVRPEAHLDRSSPAEAVFEGELLRLFRAVAAAPAAGLDPFERLQEGLTPLWRRRRPPGHAAALLLQDWSRSLALRAAVSRAGRSARQVERRVKAWTGQSRRDLEAYARSERLYALASAAGPEGAESLAGLAAEAGFADQSHMGRRIRRETGFSPARLRRLIAEREAFWCYRLFGENFF